MSIGAMLKTLITDSLRGIDWVLTAPVRALVSMFEALYTALCTAIGCLDRQIEIREVKSSTFRLRLLATIPVAALLLLWACLTNGEVEERIVSSVILPSPGEVLAKIPPLWGSWWGSGLLPPIATSTLRVAGGFLVGLLVAFPVGILMGSFSFFKAMFGPVTTFLGYLPIPALVPLTMSFFGIDEFQKVMFLALASLVYLLPLFAKAIEDVDNVYLQTAYVLGAGRREALTKVLLPIAAPKMFQAMRYGFGVGWTYIILAEMVAAERGLGHIIIVAQRRGPKEYIYLVLLVIVLIAWITDKLWAALGRKLFPYSEEM